MYTVLVYHVLVIVSFADETTRDIYNGSNTKNARKIDRQVWQVVVRKLDILHAAISLNDLKSPGNHLEKLKGSWSIRVNNKYRIIFGFENGHATDVRCQDHP